MHECTETLTTLAGHQERENLTKTTSPGPNELLSCLCCCESARSSKADGGGAAGCRRKRLRCTAAGLAAAAADAGGGGGGDDERRLRLDFALPAGPRARSWAPWWPLPEESSCDRAALLEAASAFAALPPDCEPGSARVFLRVLSGLGKGLGWAWLSAWRLRGLAVAGLAGFL